jgi:psiF repeat
MKIPTLFAALALTCGAALAVEPPAAPSATPIKHTSLKSCNKQADTKKLTGAARAQFVKDCHTSKPS